MITSEFTKNILEICEDKYIVPETRNKRGSNTILEYETGTRSVLKGSTFFYDILVEENKGILSKGIGNFVLNLLLPLPVVGSLLESSRNRFSKRYFARVFGKSAPPLEELCAGSLSEGLSLPQLIHLKGNSFVIELPDEDTKYIFHALSVSTNNKKAFAHIEQTIYSPPSYVELKLNDFYKFDLKSYGLDPDSFVNKDGYIVRDKFIAQLHDKLKRVVPTVTIEGQTVKCKDGLETDVLFSKHGPAKTVDVFDESKNLFSTDHVICLPCPVWPIQAKAWSKRKRRWPSGGLVRNIVRKGCHIIGKGQKGCKDEKTQFMFSFSLCDQTLSKAMTLNQRRCYILFKYVFKFYLNSHQRDLSSYFCKTTFLWLCESKQESDWSDAAVLDNLVELVRTFKEYLVSMFLPHFYIPEFNLIEGLPEFSKEKCTKVIDQFLQSPLKTTLQLTENHRFLWLSTDISFVKTLHTIQKQIEIKELKDIAIAPTLINFFSELLDKGEGSLVLAIVCADWHWSSKVQSDTRYCIHKLENMMSLLEGHGDLVCLQALLGNLYHQLYYETGNVRFKERSMDMLLMTQKKAGRHIWIYACLYDLLRYISENDLLLRHFLSNIRSELLYTDGIYTVLTNYNCNTSAGFNFAEMFEDAVFPTTSYLLFQVACAYIGLAQTSSSLYRRWLLRNEALKVVKHLRKWASRKCSLYPELFDDELNYLVGLAAEIVGDKAIAIKSFQESVSYGVLIWGVQYDNKDCLVVPKYLVAKTKGCFDNKNLRFQPYRKSKHGQCVGLPKELYFVNGLPRVGRFKHNLV